MLNCSYFNQFPDEINWKMPVKAITNDNAKLEAEAKMEVDNK